MSERFECTKCGNERPLSHFHKDKSTVRGHICKCKMCMSDQAKGHKNLPKIIVDEKECRGCGKVKASSEFWKNSQSKDSLCSRCKECLKKQNNGR